MHIRPCVFYILVLVVSLQSICAQNFDPNLEDGEYLNQTERKVKHEVVTSRQELIDQMETVRIATRAYIGAKIKENLFKALKSAAEKELETISMQTRPRQPRQDEDEDEGITPDAGIIPQLATIVQSIFGQNVNVTKYVENASKLLPRPIGNQLVGVANLLDPSQFTSTATPEGGPVTPPPRKGFNSSTPVPTLTFPINSSLPSSENVTTSAPALQQPPPVVQQFGEGSTTVNGESDEEEDEDSEDDFKRSLNRVKRQFAFKGIHPMMLIDGFESIWKNFGTPNATAAPSSTTPPKKYIKAGSTTETDDGFDDDYTTKPSRVSTAVSGVASQMEALRKGVPDLLQGAREAYKFLEHLNGFLDSWESRLLAGSADDD